MNLEIYQKLCAESKILWTQHCLQRMQERDISRADVKNGIATGEIIENYPDDFVKGVLVGAWDQVHKAILDKEIPF